jgi:ABC-type nitrate/sulfonate/bicarbonate transport system substrate-binding protein
MPRSQVLDLKNPRLYICLLLRVLDVRGREIVKLFRILVLVSLFQFPFGTGEAQDKVVVATLRSVSQWSFWMALESGFYKEYGLDVVPVTFTGGTQTITSLISGDVQITTTGGSTAINAALKGVDQHDFGNFSLHFLRLI